MYSPPFHRRILPWIFGAAFLVVAPALVFYTAGYRWNPKKDKIERNGTLILDSRPTGATIFLNETKNQDVTPITLQNVPPGSYLIRVEKAGYHSWQKRLNVMPEYVTFANAIRLWRSTGPTKRADLEAMTMETSPNGRLLAVIERRSDTSALSIWSAQLETSAQTELPLLSDAAKVTWASDSRGILIEDTNASGTRAWIWNTRNGNDPTLLPPGAYRWDGPRLAGASGSSLLSIRSDNGEIEIEPLTPNTVDAYDDLDLAHTTGTNNLVLLRGNNPSRGYILPPGAWHPFTMVRDRLILKNGTEWISVDYGEETPELLRARGDVLRPFEERGQTSYLLVQDGEIWRWNPLREPELLSREGRSVREALWHTSGENIAFATDQEIFMLNLDPRDGFIRTKLANFESIRDIAFLNQRLVIAGTREGQTGVWILEVE